MLNISESAAINIATMLLSHKKITEKQMEQIQNLSKESGQSIINVILEKNFASELDIANIIAKSYDLPKIKITDKNIDNKAISALPKNFIMSNQVLPFSLNNGNLKIAIADPSRLSVTSEIKTITNKNVEIFVTKLSELENGLINLSSSNQSKEISSVDNKVAPRGEDQELIETTSEVIKFVDDVLMTV